jgi:hypothetical protein
MDHGKVVMMGPLEEVTERYEKNDWATDPAPASAAK